MRKVYFFILPLILCRCSYDLVEDIQFHEDRTVDVKLSIDFSKSLDSENKDLIVSMITQSVEGFASKITGASVDLDLSLKASKEDLKPILYEIALDTIGKVQIDSIKLALTQKDTLDLLTDKQEEEISKLIRYLAINSLIRTEIDLSKKIMLFELVFKNISYDTLTYYKFDEYRKNPNLAKIDDKYSIVGKLFPEWKGNKVIRPENNYDIVKLKEGQELDDVTKKAWENSNLSIKYHFPAKIKSCSNKLYQITDNGNSAVMSQSFMDIYKRKPLTSVAIEY